MVQYSDLKYVLKGRLARFSASTSLDPRIVGELNAMMTSIEEEAFIPWFLWTNATITLVPDSYSAALPANFLRERLADSEDNTEAFAQIYVDGFAQQLKLLPKHPIRSGVIADTAQDQTRPTAYFVDNVEEKITFNAWSDAEYAVDFAYIKKGDRYATSPGDTDEPIWAKYAPEYLIALTGMRIASMYIKNTDASQVFFADVSRERTKLIHKHTAILEAKLNPNSEN